MKHRLLAPATAGLVAACGPAYQPVIIVAPPPQASPASTSVLAATTKVGAPLVHDGGIVFLGFRVNGRVAFDAEGNLAKRGQGKYALASIPAGATIRFVYPDGRPVQGVLDTDGHFQLIIAPNSRTRTHLVGKLIVTLANGRNLDLRFATGDGLETPYFNGEVGATYDLGLIEQSSDTRATMAKNPLEVIDSDGDGRPDAFDPDDDNDGFEDREDQGVFAYDNSEHHDNDLDGLGDRADTDDDNDGVADGADEDDDGDGVRDAFDNDDDNDAIPDKIGANWHHDNDHDGMPDEADPDDDNDGTPDRDDPDRDGDGIPNDQDPDDDNDGIPDIRDASDADNDGIADYLDVVPTDPRENFVNPKISVPRLPHDFDFDGMPDATDPDRDGDGIARELDGDLDNDGLPNDDDPDQYNDGIPDAMVRPGMPDADGDGMPDVFDTDANADGTSDATRDITSELPDADGDGVPDIVDVWDNREQAGIEDPEK